MRVQEAPRYVKSLALFLCFQTHKNIVVQHSLDWLLLQFDLLEFWI